MKYTLLLLGFFSYVLPCTGAEVWTNYVNRNFVNKVVTKGNEVWAATTAGIVVWDVSTGKSICYTMKDSLLLNNNRSLAVDSSGNIWTGAVGVNKFDGKKWASYSRELNDTPVGAVNDIAVDPHGVVWIAQGMIGVTSYDGRTWKNYDIQAYFNIATAIGIDKHGLPWIYAQKNLIMRFNGIEWIQYYIADMIYKLTVYGIDFDADNTLWLATHYGVYTFDGVNYSTPSGANGIASQIVNDVKIDGYQNKWFATAAGVSKLSGDTWTTYSRADGLADDYVFSITIDSAGNKWFGTSGGGVSRFDDETWTTFKMDDWLPGNRINALAADKSGMLWIGTDEGLATFKEEPQKTYTAADGLTADVVYVITVDNDNNKWFAYGDNPYGVDRFDGESWSNFRLGDGIISSKVYAVTVDREGRVWFGTASGISVFDGENWRSYTQSDGLVYNEVRALCIDGNDDLWIGTLFGISKFDGELWTNYNHSTGLPLKPVVALSVDGQNNIWAGFDNPDDYGKIELLEFNGNEWRSHTGIDDVPNNYLDSQIIDRAGNLWFGTLFGVMKFDGTEWTRYTPEYGLIYDTVLCMAQDSSGNMWFGTPGGLSMLKSDLPVSIDEKIKTPHEYVLFQNYPNPFNPITTIKYQLPKAAGVTLRIYNILGQEVRTLVNERIMEGSHEITWNGTDNAGRSVASGVYIYRLTTNEGYTASRKLVILK